MEVAKSKPQLTTLCGLKPDQTKANFSYGNLGVGDAILLAFDLKQNSALVELECVCFRPSTSRQCPLTPS